MDQVFRKCFLLVFISLLFLAEKSPAQDPPYGLVILESHLPIVAIRTNGLEISDEPKIKAFMGILDAGGAAANKFLSDFHNYSYTIGIELRGQSSQYFYPKKSYSLETRDSLGENLNISLLGLAPENDWILYGPYGDKSLLRNYLVYDWAAKMMLWAPKLVFCELIINNSYQGIYLLGEKIKRDKNRVNVSKLLAKDTAGLELTGGYIIKLDKGEQDPAKGWYSTVRPNNTWSGRIFFQYHYPEASQIQEKQSAYIQEYMRNFEEALNGPDFKDPFIGYRKYMDVGSFVDFFLLNELSRNVDGYRLSSYLYKDKDGQGGKLRMGPVWDYNLGFGNANYCEGSSFLGWAYQFNRYCSEDYWPVPFWWDRLLEDVYFRNTLKTRWLELRSGILREDSIMEKIRESSQDLGPAVSRNTNRWPVFGIWIWPNSFVGRSYQEEIDFLKSWIQNRIQWMDTYLPGVKIPNGIEEFKQNDLYRLGPNPFRDHLSLIPDSMETYEGRVLKVYRIDGQLILEENISIPSLVFSTGDWPPGLYLYQLADTRGALLGSGKLVKY